MGDSVSNGALLDELMKLFRNEKLKDKISEHGEDVETAAAALSLSSAEGLTSPASFALELDRTTNQIKSTDLFKRICADITEHSPETAELLSNGFAGQSHLPTLLSVLQSDQELSPLLQEIDQLGALAFVTFWQKPELMGKSPESSPDAVAKYKADDSDDEHQLTLHAAVMDEDQQLLHDLLHEGSDVNELDEEGRTALHTAGALGEDGCMLSLLSAGADVNALDNMHNTALHYAAGYGMRDSVLILLKNGADPTLRNLDGQTALQLAKLNNEFHVIQVLGRSLVRE
jgi:hypothetical protein